MIVRYNITTDETRVPKETEAKDGYYVHATDYDALDDRFRALVKSMQNDLVHDFGLDK